MANLKSSTLSGNLSVNGSISLNGEILDLSKFVTSEAAKSYLTKTTSTSSYDRLYGIGSGGSQIIYNIAQNAYDANSIVRRTSSGEIIAASPTTNNSAVTKSYLETNAALIGKSNNLITNTNEFNFAKGMTENTVYINYTGVSAQRRNK